MVTLERTVSEPLRDLIHRIEILEARIGRMQAERETAVQLRDLAHDGYVRGIGPIAREAAEIDRRAAAESTCEECGHSGLGYESWHVPGNAHSYRAFTICPNCGDRTEV